MLSATTIPGRVKPVVQSDTAIPYCGPNTAATDFPGFCIDKASGKTLPRCWHGESFMPQKDPCWDLSTNNPPQVVIDWKLDYQDPKVARAARPEFVPFCDALKIDDSYRGPCRVRATGQMIQIGPVQPPAAPFVYTVPTSIIPSWVVPAAIVGGTLTIGSLLIAVLSGRSTPRYATSAMHGAKPRKRLW
jgi:hypothetical protein